MTDPLIGAPPLQIGDKVHLGAFVATINAFGVIGDLDTPDQTYFTIEGFGGNAILTTSALVGPKGIPGSNAPAPKLQEPIYDSVDELPTNLVDDPIDVGKYWIIREWDTNTPPNQIGSWFYIWYGDHYEQFRMGSPGQAGPVPNITPSVELLDPDNPALSDEIDVTGTSFDPAWHFKLKAPRGPEGPATNIADAPDVDMTPTPETGDTLVYNAADGKWHPSTLQAFVPRFYTYPEGSFTDVALAFGTSVPIGTAVIPPAEFNAVPIVFGHFKIDGVELDTTPFMVGVEVRLGSTTGTLVARGWGNSSTFVYVIPHTSTGTSPGDAITPTNGRGVIPAGTTGADATLYVSCFNDGVAGAYHFEKAGAQLSVQLFPV